MQYFHLLLLAYPLRMAEGEGSKTVIEHISRSPQGTLTDIQTQYGFYARCKTNHTAHQPFAIDLYHED